MGRFLAGVAFAVCGGAAATLTVALLGWVPVSADRPPSLLETRVLGVVLRNAVAAASASEVVARPSSSADLANGREVYREMCARCHGESGKPPSSLGAAFYPPAPALAGRESPWSESELFWIIKHGIRNTAMPAWGNLLSDDDIRDVAVLLKRFDPPSA